MPSAQKYGSGSHRGYRRSGWPTSPGSCTAWTRRSCCERQIERAVARSRSEASLPSRQRAEPAWLCPHPWAAAGQEYSSAQQRNAWATLGRASQVRYSHSWIRANKLCQSSSPAKPIRCVSAAIPLYTVSGRAYPGSQANVWKPAQVWCCVQAAKASPDSGSREHSANTSTAPVGLMMGGTTPTVPKHTPFPGEASRCIFFLCATQYLQHLGASRSRQRYSAWPQCYKGSTLPWKAQG